jgi:probable F420-dependent oxidoreductase
VKIDVPLHGELAGSADAARRLADAGAAGAFTFEGPHDAFAPLVLAAVQKLPIDLYTNVAIAFPRSPLHLAHIAYDLQTLSAGHFRLGLGSQIRAHVEFRYGARWSSPVARMREWVEATKAIFATWQDGSPLEFLGEHTRHTMMPPTFNPGPNAFGMPPIVIGAVGPMMTRMAAEATDGLIVHPLNSERTIREHSLPRVEEGLRVAGRDRSSFLVTASAMVGVWRREEDRPRIEQALRGMIAFYGSTPAYRLMLDIEGYGELQPELRALTKQGRWAEMPSLVDDELLDRFTVRGTPAEVGKGLTARYSGAVERVALSPQGGLDIDSLAELNDAAL